MGLKDIEKAKKMSQSRVKQALVKLPLPPPTVKISTKSQSRVKQALVKHGAKGPKELDIMDEQSQSRVKQALVKLVKLQNLIWDIYYALVAIPR